MALKKIRTIMGFCPPPSNPAQEVLEESYTNLKENKEECLERQRVAGFQVSEDTLNMDGGLAGEHHGGAMFSLPPCLLVQPEGACSL